MFHRDCYQILLLNFKSSTETCKSILPRKRFFALGGGGYITTFLKSWQQSIFQVEKLTENSCQYGRIS